MVKLHLTTLYLNLTKICFSRWKWHSFAFSLADFSGNVVNFAQYLDGNLEVIQSTDTPLSTLLHHKVETHQKGFQGGVKLPFKDTLQSFLVN